MDEQTGAPTPTQTPPVINEGPATLAQQIKAKHPEYEHIPDATLEAVAIAHNPEYAQLPRTHVSPQEAIAAMHQANASVGLENKKPVDLGETMKGVAGGVATEAGNMIKGAASLTPGMGYFVPGTGPINAVKNIASDTAGELGQAYDSAKQGNIGSAVHHAASAIPIVGPTVRGIAEEYGQTGDAPHAIGRGLAAVGAAKLPAVAEGAGRAAEAVGNTSLGIRVADAAAVKGGETVSKAITPVRGAGATKFAGMANDIGESLATDPALGGITKPGFHLTVQSELDKAGQALDVAADARLKGRPIETQPIIDALESVLANKTQARPLEASRIGPPKPSTPSGQNIGIGPGEPHPYNAAGMANKATPMGKVVDLSDPQTSAQAEQIRKAIDEIKSLGPQTSYEALQKIRQSYDTVAKPGVYITTPADVLTAGKNVGSARGAADVAGTVRETLAQADPVTAKANARFSMLRRADDVMEALKISEQTRPGVGRAIFAGMAGGMAAGKIGLVLGPAVDLALRSGPSAQLVVGRALGQLSEMIRKGDAAGAASVAGKLRIAAGAGEAGETPQRPMAVSGLDIKGGG